MLKIEFATENAAFCDPRFGEPDEYYIRAECCRILEEVLDKIEDGFDSGSILDINGNKVGSFELT